MNFPPFEFDLGPIQGFPLMDSFGYGANYINDGSVVFEIVVLIFSNFYIEISVNIDNDEIILKKVDDNFKLSGDRWKKIDALKNIKGKPVGWAWSGTNWLGYRDTVMFSFSDSGMIPDVIMMGEASDIRVYRIRD